MKFRTLAREVLVDWGSSFIGSTFIIGGFILDSFVIDDVLISMCIAATRRQKRGSIIPISSVSAENRVVIVAL